MKWRKTQSWRSVATKFVKSVYSVGFEKDWFDFSIAKAAWSRGSVKRTSKCRKRGPQRFCLDAWPCLLFVLACNTQNLWKTWNNSVYCDVEQQGARRSVTRLDGARGKEQIWRPMFEPEVFRKQMYCIDESTCDIAWNFWLPEICSPLVMPLGARQVDQR